MGSGSAIRKGQDNCASRMIAGAIQHLAGMKDSKIIRASGGAPNWIQVLEAATKNEQVMRRIFNEELRDDTNSRGIHAGRLAKCRQRVGSASFGTGCAAEVLVVALREMGS
jgi:hypothetical protein